MTAWQKSTRRMRLIGLLLVGLAGTLCSCSAEKGSADGGSSDVLPDSGRQRLEAGREDGRFGDLAADSAPALDLPLGNADAGGEAGPGIDLGLACSATLGSAAISGTVQGQSFPATRAAGLSFGSGIQGYMVFFVEQQSCTTLGQPPLPAFGLTLCDTVPGSYPVEESCTTGTTLGVKSGISVILDGPDLKASEGTIQLELYEPGCGGRIKGSFQADFAGEAVSGIFDTVGCD